MDPVRRVKARVGARGTVKVLEKVDLPPGECEVLVLPANVERAKTPEARPLKPALEKVVGLWADRDDITDSAEFASELRRKLETGRDRRE